MQDRTGRMPEKLQGLWRGVPAWSATFLFAFQPVAQLVDSHPPIAMKQNAEMPIRDHTWPSILSSMNIDRDFRSNGVKFCNTCSVEQHSRSTCPPKASNS